MKKLHFINGALFAAVLAGASIVKVENDGYDYQVLVRTAKESKSDISQFKTYSTANYAEKINEFVEKDTYGEKVTLRDATAEFERYVKAQSDFKKEYARPDSACPSNLEETAEEA